jgi:hypothetical protein
VAAIHEHVCHVATTGPLQDEGDRVDLWRAVWPRAARKIDYRQVSQASNSYLSQMLALTKNSRATRGGHCKYLSGLRHTCAYLRRAVYVKS